MQYRIFNPDADTEAVHRIVREVGWFEKDNLKAMDTLIEGSRTLVSDIGGVPECLALSFSGDIDYSGEKLSFSCIGAVMTSLIARKQKLAGRLTAARIALDAVEGHLVSGLGIFDQGYYDKLGYGTRPYEHIVKILSIFPESEPDPESTGQIVNG